MDDLINKRKDLLARAEGIIFPYSDQWVESHKAFAAKMWPNKLRRRDEAYNRWKFRGPLHGDVPGFLLAVLDGKVVGQLGLIPVKIWVDGREVNAQWACDLMVDNTIRQKGIGSLLLAVGMERNIITLGSNPSELADLSMTKLGFKSLQGPSSMILPLELSHFFEMVFKGKSKLLSSFFSLIFQPVWNLRLKLLIRPGNNQVLEGGCDEVIPFVKAYQSTIDKPHIIHDDAFLKWRTSVVIPANIQFYFTKAGSYAICEPTSSNFYIYDWHIKVQGDGKAIFGRILELAMQAKSKMILAYANSNQERKLLRQRGFLKMRTPVKVIYYPPEVISEKINSFHYCIYDSDGNL